MNKDKILTAIGFDLSTTALTMAGRTANGEEVFVSLPMEGATVYKGQPGFDLSFLPGLFRRVLGKIQEQGFSFAAAGVFSGSVRQHDMVVLNHLFYPILPALSWQANAGVVETAALNLIVERVVGRIEPRFILPKLAWVLKQDSNLCGRIEHVMTTGDYIAAHLTGVKSLSSSDALSNGLLQQDNRRFATEVLTHAELDPAWFPPVIQSGEVVGDIRLCSGPWEYITRVLEGWKFISILGDNHAGAVGSGLSDQNTIVVSAGTSGTVTRVVKSDASTRRKASKFEFYHDTLLLLMLADCGSLYNRFKEEFGAGKSHAELDNLAMEATRSVTFLQPPGKENVYPAQFRGQPLAVQVASVQAYLATELYRLLVVLTQEANIPECEIQKVVLTGGLSASPYFRKCFKMALSAKVRLPLWVSARTGSLANQAATLGALINAMVGGGQFSSRDEAAKVFCPLTPFD